MNATLARLRRLTAAHATPDAVLLEHFLSGDQGAFALLVRRHAGLVFATCQRVLRHRQDAEDAFQATFLVLARRAGDVWPREAVGSWLFGVARRVALKARTVRARRTAREGPPEDPPAPDAAAPDFDLIDRVQRAVARLPEVYRAAVVACDLQGLSRKEAAERLGWSEGTLSGRLARARAILATRLRRLGVTAPAGLAVLTAAEGTPAALAQSAIELTTGKGVPSPVAALTEGVVSGMALFKLKAMAAVLVTACAVGFGALAASGDGPGDKPGGPPTGATQAPRADAKPPAPRRDSARAELEALAQELSAAAKGEVDAETLARLKDRLGAAERSLAPAAEPPSDLDPLQGEWQVVSISDGKVTDRRDERKAWDGWVVTVRGGTLRMPYQTAGLPLRYRESKVAVDGSKQPKEIDLIEPNQPVGRGIYEFTVPTQTCAACHDDGKDAARKLGTAPPPVGLLGVCGPGLKTLLIDGKAVGLRLAFGTDGKRPAKFGGDGVIVLELVRDALPPKAPDATRRDLERARAELERATAQLAHAESALALAREVQKRAEQQVASAQRAAEQAKRNPPAGAADGPAFTVHVRPLTAAEQVVRVKLTGSETVLDALTHAPDLPIKAGAVTAWVVRGDEILPIDLVGITQHGITKTNYAMRAGDKLFVQAKPAK